MPFASQAQQRKCYALKAKGQNGSWDCSEFSKHTDFSKLPKRKRKEAADMTETIAALGRKAAEKPLLEKFAADTGLAPAVLANLAEAAKLSVADLARAAYADPPAFAKFAQARLTSNAGPTTRTVPVTNAGPTVKTAAPLEATFLALARTAIEKKAAANKKLSAMTLMNHYLDKVAAKLPMTKQASVRVLQSELALGKPLSFAIKRAFPQLSAERRGIVAQKLVKGAADDFAKFVGKKTGRESVAGKPGSPEVSKLMKSANVGVGTRVVNAVRNMLGSQGQAARAGGRAFNAANDVRGRVRNMGVVGSPGRAEAGPIGKLTAHRAAGAEHARGMQAARGQAVGDQLKARLAAMGLGGAGLGAGATAAAKPAAPAQPQKPATARA